MRFERWTTSTRDLTVDVLVSTSTTSAKNVLRRLYTFGWDSVEKWVFCVLQFVCYDEEGGDMEAMAVSELEMFKVEFGGGEREVWSWDSVEDGRRAADEDQITKLVYLVAPIYK